MAFQQGLSSQNDQPAERPPNYLIQSILLTLCCCLPGGIVALVFSVKANSMAEAGDMDAAWETAKKAKLWCWISLGVGLVVQLISILVNVVPLLAMIATGEIVDID